MGDFDGGVRCPDTRMAGEFGQPLPQGLRRGDIAAVTTGFFHTHQQAAIAFHVAGDYRVDRAGDEADGPGSGERGAL